jgi:hypothetical protein
MALVRNSRSIFQNPGSFRGVFTFQNGNFIKGGLRNRDAGGFNNVFSAYPSGSLNPNTFIMPQKAGALASRTVSSGAISPFVNLIPAIPMDGSSAIVLTVTNAQLDQIVSFVANALLTMSGSAQLDAAISMQVNGALALTTSANIQAIISTLASGSMAITPNAVLTALAHMNAEAGGPTPLSPEGLANAVWDTVLADHQITGSTGKALSDAGGAGNPWSADLATNNTSGTFGALVQKLLTVAKFLGLK